MMQRFQEAEHVFVPADIKTTSTENLKNFITKNFQIPDNNIEKICKFIKQDKELEKIIFELPDTIKNEVHYDNIQITFYDEFQEDELILEITIISKLDFNTQLKKEDEFIHILYKKYIESSVDKILIFIEG